MTQRVLRTFALASVLLALGACGGSDQPEQARSVPTSEPVAEVSTSPDAALHDLAGRLSDGNAEVAAELLAFTDDRDLYESEYAPIYLAEIYGPSYLESDGDELVADWIEGRTPAEALIDALWRAGHLAHVDAGQEANDVLLQLDNISGGALSTTSWYDELLQEYETSPFGIGEFLDNDDDQQLRTLVGESGVTLEAVDNNSDSYALVLIPSDELNELYELAELAEIDFYFLRQGR